MSLALIKINQDKNWSTGFIQKEISPKNLYIMRFKKDGSDIPIEHFLGRLLVHYHYYADPGQWQIAIDTDVYRDISTNEDVPT